MRAQNACHTNIPTTIHPDLPRPQPHHHRKHIYSHNQPHYVWCLVMFKFCTASTRELYLLIVLLFAGSRRRRSCGRASGGPSALPSVGVPPLVTELRGNLHAERHRTFNSAGVQLWNRINHWRVNTNAATLARDTAMSIKLATVGKHPQQLPRLYWTLTTVSSMNRRASHLLQGTSALCRRCCPEAMLTTWPFGAPSLAPLWLRSRPSHLLRRQGSDRP